MSRSTKKDQFDSQVNILDNTESAKEEFDDQVGSFARTERKVTREHLEALLNGKCLGIYDGEHTVILTLDETVAGHSDGDVLP